MHLNPNSCRIAPGAETHRADIQSLRALAVALVVAAHAKVPWLSGGYVGVDVFFVLSGYLISGLILREIEISGSFDPWRFYARRLKRLLPAMLLVTLVTGGIAWITISPQQQLDTSAAGQAAALWLSNFYFATRAINYFSSGIQGNLFLHTWSLSVEEQFYLAWPWLLLFLYGHWKWQGATVSYMRLASGLGMLALLSLLLAIYWAYESVENGFYLMPGMAWEFAIGALVLLLRQRSESGRIAWLERWRGRSILNSVGWLSILFAAVAYNDNLRYPGVWALLPCIGAALALLDAPKRQPNSVMSRLLLRQPILQFLGNISYSLYLWHWPVLNLGNQVFGTSLAIQLGLVSLCLILATATYYLLENPIHRAPIGSSASVLVTSLSFIAFGFFAMTTWEKAAEELLNGPETARIQAARFDIPELYSSECDTWHHSAKVSPCIFGHGNASKTVVMIGDSALAQWFPAISDIFLRRTDWRVIVLTKSACPASQVSYYYDRIKANYDICDAWRQGALEFIAQQRPDLVIMGSRNYPFTPEQWITGTETVLKRLTPVAGSVIIMSPTPDLGFDGPNCLTMKANVPTWMPHHGRCETRLDLPSSPGIRQLLAKAASPYSNVGVIDLSESVCPNATCRARLSGDIVFRDSQHLTASFVLSLASVFEQALDTAGAFQQSQTSPDSLDDSRSTRDTVQ